MIIHIENAAKLDKQYKQWKEFSKVARYKIKFPQINTILYSSNDQLSYKWTQIAFITAAGRTNHPGKQYATKDALDKANGPVAGWEEIFANIYIQIYLQKFICLPIKDGSLNLDD